MITRARSTVVLALTLLALSSGGCGLLSFDVSQDIAPQTIPGNPLAALLPPALFSVPINVDINSETAGHGTGPAKSATLSALSLTVTAPAGGTFDFLTSIAISVSSSADPSLPEQQIAKLEPVPGTTTINIPPSPPGVNLLPYVKAGATVKATVSGHSPSQDITFTGKVVITIHV